MTWLHTATTMQVQLACPRHDPHTPPVGLDLGLDLGLGVEPELALVLALALALGVEEEWELLHCHGQRQLEQPTSECRRVSWGVR